MPIQHRGDNIRLGDGPIGPNSEGIRVDYMGSMFTAEGGSATDVRNIVKAAWAKCREVYITPYKKMPITLKYKIYKTTVKPAMLYGFECWAVRKTIHKNYTPLR